MRAIFVLVLALWSASLLGERSRSAESLALREYRVRLETSKGPIVIEDLATGRRAPPIDSTSWSPPATSTTRASSASSRDSGAVRDQRRSRGRQAMARADVSRRGSGTTPVEYPRHGRLCLQGSRRPDDAGVHRPAGQLEPGRAGLVPFGRVVEGLEAPMRSTANTARRRAEASAPGNNSRCSTPAMHISIVNFHGSDKLLHAVVMR